MLQIRSTHSF